MSEGEFVNILLTSTHENDILAIACLKGYIELIDMLLTRFTSDFEVLNDGIYCLSPQSLSNKCLGDGTYRLSPLSASDRVFAAYNLTAPVGEVLTMKDTNQYRFGPRGAWEREKKLNKNISPGIRSNFNVISKD